MLLLLELLLLLVLPLLLLLELSLLLVLSLLLFGLLFELLFPELLLAGGTGFEFEGGVVSSFFASSLNLSIAALNEAVAEP